MDINQLIYFKTVAQCEKIVDASKMLYISQPALTMSIKKFETEIGYELFDRKKNSIKLNPAGKIVLEYTNHILSMLDKMHDDLNDLAGSATSLNIYASTPPFMKMIVAQYLKSNPGINTYTFTEKEDVLTDLLLSGQADIIFNNNKINKEGVSSVFYYIDGLYASIPKGHRLYDRKYLTLKDFNGETVIRSTNYGQTGIQFDNAMKKNGYSFNTVYCSDFTIYEQITSTSPYIFFSNATGLFGSKYIKDRKYIFVRDEDTKVQIYISYLINNKKIQHFANWILMNYKEIVALSELQIKIKNRDEG